MKSPVTTHVLDTMRGKPAVGVKALLESRTAAGEWKEIGRGQTDTDGRINELADPRTPLAAGVYRITFLTAAYFASVGVGGFYPSVTVTFELSGETPHCHVPLLLSPFGYSTYRGS